MTAKSSEAVEQRISLLKSIGFDTTEEEKAYEKRLTLLQFDDEYLKSEMPSKKVSYFEEVSQKVRYIFIKKYFRKQLVSCKICV